MQCSTGDWLLNKPTSHLQQVFLAAIHDVLRGQTVDHVAGVEDDEEEDHAEEEEGLRSGSLRPDLIQLHKKKQEHPYISHMTECYESTALWTAEMHIYANNTALRTTKTRILIAIVVTKLY